MEFWKCILIILSLATAENLDPCKQPLGMKNGLIKRSQIVTKMDSWYRVRKGSDNNHCWAGKDLEINLEKEMTITGISIFTKEVMKGIHFQYYKKDAYWKIRKDGDDYMTFNYTKNNFYQDIWFEKDFFTAQRLKIIFPSKATCLKIELYGCAQTCHYNLPTSLLNQRATAVESDGFLACSNLTKDIVLTLTRPVLLNGFIIDSSSYRFTLTCRLNNLTVYSKIPFDSFKGKKITYWFDQTKVCDEFIIKPCNKVMLLGCLSGCTSIIGIANASSFDQYGNSVYNQSYLNNENGSWQHLISTTRNATEQPSPWIRICFSSSIIISGLALQGQGRFGSGHIKKYTIQFKKDNQFYYQNYTNINGSLTKFFSGITGRYGTYTNMFKEPIQAKCIQLTAISCASLNNGGCALRWDVLGCRETYVDHPEVTITNCSNTSVYFKWKFHTSMKEFIVNGYKISLLKRNRSMASLITNLTIGRFDDLTPYTKYTLKIYAYNRFGVESREMAKTFLTKEGIPTAPVNLKIINVNRTKIEVSWNPPSSLNGKLLRYEVQMNESKPYDIKFELWKVNWTDASFLYRVSTGIKYKISVRAWTMVGPGSYAEVVVEAQYERPGKGNIVVIKDNLFYQQVQLANSSLLTGIVQKYELNISSNAEATQCTTTNVIKSIIVKFHKEENMMSILIPKGHKEISFGNDTFQMELIGTYMFSFRAFREIRNERLFGEAGIVFVERRDLQMPTSLKQTDPSKLTITMPKVPQSTTHYVIIISRSNITEEPKLLQAFNSSNLSAPYVTAVFEKARINETFLIGDGETYSFGRTTSRRSVLRAYHNVPLQPGTVYFILVRAHKNETLYYSTPLITLKTPSTSEATTPSGKPTILSTLTTTSYYSTPLITLKTLNTIEATTPLGKPTILSTLTTTSYYSTPLITLKTPNTSKATTPFKLQTTAIISTLTTSSTMEMSSSTTTMDPLKTLDRLKSNSTKKIIITFFAVMGVVIVLFVVLFVYRTKFIGEYKIYFFKRDSNCEIILSNSAAQSASIETKTYYQPINISNLNDYWEDLKKDQFLKAKEEFLKLKSGQLHAWSEASSPKSMSKNRYQSILCYDHSRIKLENCGDSNYINASFIHGYAKQNFYIAAQGPLEATLGDFWCMIWEQNVSVIVMLTNLNENEKCKCGKYWQENCTETYGEIHVENRIIQTYRDYIIRIFEIRKEGGQEIRIAYHYQYIAWPEQDVPEFPYDLLKFRRQIRRNHPINIQNTPMLVHGSAGIGRTGTFICIDNMLKLAHEKSIVDVFNYVIFMRSRRINMVHTLRQYIFIYYALFEANTCDYTEISAGKYLRECKRLAEQQGTKTGFQLEFQQLQNMMVELCRDESIVALKDENKIKNRCSIVPRDEGRVVLWSNQGDQGHTSYINAVFVNGYNKNHAFIATHNPLPNTTGDFWQMIFFNKVKLVVDLNAKSYTDTIFPQFVPLMDAEATFNDILVKTTDEEDEGSLSTKNVILTQQGQSSSEDLETTIITYDGWPQYDVPNDTTELLKILIHSQPNQLDSSSPVVVMCSDGAGCTGTYIAICNILEQLRTENAVDVCQTIRRIRMSRPEFVANIIQYKFCYTVLAAYMEKSHN